MAIGVLAALMNEDFKVPKDISIIGFNNDLKKFSLSSCLIVTINLLMR